MIVDFIIVGQGLAGSLLAFELLSRHKTLVIIDDPNQLKASEIAAGLINPVVFRRMTKSWLVDDVFPQMEISYRQLEDLLKVKLYYPSQILNILDEISAVNWKEKTLTNQLEEYLDTEPKFSFKNQYITAPFGFGHVKKAGRLDIQKLITSFSIFLKQHNLLELEKFDFEKLFVNQELVSYNDIIAKKIIFCEGVAISQNPYFTNLKFQHSKGEILLLELPKINLNEIISQEIFVLPLSDDRYKIGATYSWNELNWETSIPARKELLTKLKNLISAPFKIIEQKAGIRPTMHDRKPVAGIHPKHPQIGIFNGLGSKGVLLGPYFAYQLADFLTGVSDYIHPEVNIRRYFRNK